MTQSVAAAARNITDGKGNVVQTRTKCASSGNTASRAVCHNGLVSQQLSLAQLITRDGAHSVGKAGADGLVNFLTR